VGHLERATAGRKRALLSADIDALIPEFQPYARALVDLAGRAGLQPRVTSTLRTHPEQKRLYDRYLAGLQQFPVAPPGHSAHEFGFAVDIVLSPFDYLADLGQIWKDAGGKWGASDPVHFEFPGFDWRDFAGTTEGASDTVTLWDLIGTASWFTSLPGALLELAHIAMSRSEAENIARELKYIYGSF